MSPDLQEAIENAYRVFARYDLRGGVNVCHCNVCGDREIERQLNTVLLREISSRLTGIAGYFYLPGLHALRKLSLLARTAFP